MTTFSSQQKAKELILRLPQAVRETLKIVVGCLTATSNLYLVGGTVRDAVLGVTIKDIDLTVENIKAEEFATRLVAILGGELNCYSPFDTCTLKLESGLVLDIATARKEYYKYPGALPEVTPSDIYQDLSRRDFSINALAVCLHPEPIDIIDLYKGLNDLKNKTLRILHPLSFAEDSTRIIRGARLAGRLDLEFDTTTLKQLFAALVPEILTSISNSRLKAELELTLKEKKVTPALLKLAQTGALKAMFGMSVDKVLLERLDKLSSNLVVPSESYLLALLLTIVDDELEQCLESFQWPKSYLKTIQNIKTIRKNNDLTREQLQKSRSEEIILIRVFSNELEARVSKLQTSLNKRALRGQDILELGLPAGPSVGIILAKIAKERHQGNVNGFLEELELAKKLVKTYLN